MIKKSFYLLTLSIFIGVNAAQPPTDATKKINDILNKMGIQDFANGREQYVEVSPDAQHINTYNTNHQCIDNLPISARMREILNKNNTTQAEQEEAIFFCYHFGTKFKNADKVEKEFRTKNIILKSIFSGTSFATSMLLLHYINIPDYIIKKKLSYNSKEEKLSESIKFFFSSLPFFAINTIFSNWFSHHCKKQDKKELNEKTFYNLGFHTDEDFSYLFEKMKSPAFKKAFEKGKKAVKKMAKK